jgi:3-oxoacyl-[acyl-carrier protein] reductase
MNVVITGGSRGIGAACVKEFTEHGDKVAFIYKSSDEAANKLSEETGAVAIKADISIRSEALNAIKKAEDLLGSIDVLINNAGVSSVGLFTDVTPEEYERVRSTNLDAAIWCAQAALIGMIRQKSGHIINVSSIWGQNGGSCEVIYSATKAALIGFTKALAKEVGPSGITVNCVAPGVIKTDMNACFDDTAMRELADAAALCRIGEAKEVAKTVSFLASDAASYITGEVISVNGGIVI